MGRHCSVCVHPNREDIDRDLVSGESLISVCSRYFPLLSKSSLDRHQSDHLPALLTKAQAAQEVTQADDLLLQVKHLQGKALQILQTASDTGDLRSALGAIREARGCVELLAKLLGELSDVPTVNILLVPEWVTVRTLLLEALQPFPDARIAVSSRLDALGAAGGR